MMRTFRDCVMMLVINSSLWQLNSVAVLAQSAVRDSNAGNCAGTTSCRPRCLAFRVDSTRTDCNTGTGVFATEGLLNPWDVGRFRAFNCMPAGTCFNDLCGQDLSLIKNNLTIRIGEEGDVGSYHYTKVDLSNGQDTFTHCSIYPCTKQECALPEQMGTELQFEFLTGDVPLDAVVDPFLVLKLFLKVGFEGTPLAPNTENRYGPLHVEWMDDPTSCRIGQFSAFAPTQPPLVPLVFTDTSDFAFNESLHYCQGSEYLPAPLPETVAPSSTPSLAPSLSKLPTIAPTRSLIGQQQLDALASFYLATEMNSDASVRTHNWFQGFTDYCDFTGVECDSRGYVITLNLSNSRLAGTLPTTIRDLSKLRQLKVVSNRLGGTIPVEVALLDDLTQLELAGNDLTGTIPVGLGHLRHLRRLMVQTNLLEGTLPNDLCDLNALSAIDISFNIDMYGEIPECYGNLPLDVFRIEEVGLVGRVPPKLCDLRKLNGLNPNTFGCDAIGCPAGFFEPTIGRTQNAQTVCLPCAVPSNVLGSRSCQLLENNTNIAMPSTLPSLLPSTFPSPSLIEHNPSRLPSVVPSGAVTASMSPSDTKPSAVPSTLLSSEPPSTVKSSLSVSPSHLPSAEPSMSVTTVAKSTLSPVVTTLLPQTAIPTPAPTPDSTLQSPSSMPSQVVSKTVTPSSSVSIPSVAPSWTLMPSPHLSSSVSPSFPSGFPSVYPSLSPSNKASEAVNEPLGVIETNGGNGTNWWLSAAAVALSVMAVGIVWYVRKSRMVHQHQAMADGSFSGSVMSSSTRNHDEGGGGGKGGGGETPEVGDDMSVESSSGWHSDASPEEFVNPIYPQHHTPSATSWETQSTFA